jgi:hypothetical protein
MHSQPTPPARGTFLSPPSPAIRERRARGPLTACKQGYLPRPNGQGDAYCKNYPSDASPDPDRSPHATDIKQLRATRLKTSHTRTRCVTRHDAAPPAASGPPRQASAGHPPFLRVGHTTQCLTLGLTWSHRLGGRMGAGRPALRLKLRPAPAEATVKEVAL